jgi:hypothetical protein
MSHLLSYLARIGAYLITTLLAAIWTVDALDTLLHPLYDLGRRNVGEVILALTRALGLSPHATFQFAHLLAGLKLMVGALLLTALIGAIYEKVRHGTSDDALLDVALFTAGIASVASAMPGLIHGGVPLQEVMGELLLCVFASGLAIYGRGYLVRKDWPGPQRPAFDYARAD